MRFSKYVYKKKKEAWYSYKENTDQEYRKLYMTYTKAYLYWKEHSPYDNFYVTWNQFKKVILQNNQSLK